MEEPLKNTGSSPASETVKADIQAVHLYQKEVRRIYRQFTCIRNSYRRNYRQFTCIRKS
jgi:hypothetical protein